MRITLPKILDYKVHELRQKIMPKTLFFRTMLLIIVPLVVVQIVSIVAYFHGSWGKVGKRLSDNLGANMAFVVALNEQNPADFAKVKELAKNVYGMDVEYTTDDEKYKVLNTIENSNLVTGFFEAALKTKFPKAKTTLYLKNKRNLVALIDTKGGLYRFETSTKAIFNSSLFGFIAWMVGTSFLLFGVSTLFLRVQARSIRELADAAQDFGKGVNSPFKPYGSIEVRKAGVEFNKMKERIKRQLSERTQMLAGVSHDLRTPITRMKLSLAMMEQTEENKAFLEDVLEMEKMLEGYLSFARGDGQEKSVNVDMNALIAGIVAKFQTDKNQVKYEQNKNISLLQGREQALKRMVSNILSNACRYAKNIEVKLEENNNRLEITVDDDGPGIPENKRDEVFKAFYRLEESRNKETGGVGLGLSITKDIVRSHGGTIRLSDSPMGGLKVEIKLPL
ncbi:MAG: two-component sensor histidine kinase [Alphaproteobacteria bacterium]|nr:two-component sensor histidine kinase [Alphaproteobacteria bacterium]